MCTAVEIDISKETIANLKKLAIHDLENTLDPCSLEMLTKSKIKSFEELTDAVGRAYINSIIHTAVKAGMHAEQQMPQPKMPEDTER